MSLSTFVEAFLDGFTPGWSCSRRRPGVPEYLFAQSEEVTAEESPKNDENPKASRPGTL
jgi:hypothetical protein